MQCMDFVDTGCIHMQSGSILHLLWGSGISTWLFWRSTDSDKMRASPYIIHKVGPIRNGQILAGVYLIFWANFRSDGYGRLIDLANSSTIASEVSSSRTFPQKWSMPSQEDQYPVSVSILHILHNLHTGFS